MTESVLPAADQERFLEIYARNAEEIAADLARFDINGMAVYRTARKSITPAGKIDCREAD
jgi:hypothetical protein